MRKPILLIAVLLIFSNTWAQANKEDVLLTINSEPVTVEEFERIYTKNNQDASFDKTSLEEYMELFINFKLKVFEAKARGLDTLDSFIKELRGYRYQLEKPYLTDSKADSILMQEAYERMQYAVEASHILLKCDQNTLPEDTLKLYNKLEEIRNNILSGKVSFESMAKKHSEDTYTALRGGDLGYFSAFAMVYQFESAAFNTNVGDISPIIRSNFGYHIVKVTDKKEVPGQLRVAHIMKATPKTNSKQKNLAQEKAINQIYDSIMAGADFKLMVKNHSDDKGTVNRGGELKTFGYGSMIPEFQNAAFALKTIGEVSKPVKTPYGWHLIKLLEVDSLGSFESRKEYIKNKVSKDVRASKGEKSLLVKLKKEYNVTVYREKLKPFYTIIDSTVLDKKWDKSKADGLNDIMFVINDTVKYTQADFAEHMSRGKMRILKNTPIRVLIDRQFDGYVNRKVMQYETEILPVKYPEFRYLLQEYHDGILLFNLSDELVWSKAIKDTLGLESFYAENKNNYKWEKRVEATQYRFNKSDYNELIKNYALKIGKKKKDVIRELNKFVDKNLAKDSTFSITVSKNKFIKGDNELIDSLGWEPGIKNIVKDNDEFVLVYVNQVIENETKLLNEARGHITADYQTYLEKQWIAELRNKYQVEVNQDIFTKMIK